jgi:hypothetical protein
MRSYATSVDEPADVLASAVDAAIGPWVERAVARIMVAYAGVVPPEVAADARQAGEAATAAVGVELRRLLALDVERQPTNPLSILRAAVRYPTAVLQRAGVPPVVRDEFRERAFPDDVYDLAPASWRDVDEALHEPGIIWGAWKAKTVLDRRHPA